MTKKREHKVAATVMEVNEEKRLVRAEPNQLAVVDVPNELSKDMDREER